MNKAMKREPVPVVRGENLSLPTGNKAPDPPTVDRIRARAYEIYLARKGAPGDALSDWLQAERELKAGYEAARQAASSIRGELMVRHDK